MNRFLAMIIVALMLTACGGGADDIDYPSAPITPHPDNRVPTPGRVPMDLAV